MASSVVYETVCPACSRTFDLAPGSTEGNCPHCKAYLRFVEEQPTPDPTPDAQPAPTEPSAVDIPPPRVGEFRVDCAACHRGFNVPAEAEAATCPHCLTSLQLQDEYADRGIEFPVRCPACETLHEVPLESSRGGCPHCGAKLEYENQYADVAPPAPEGAGATQEPEPESFRPTEAPTPEPVAPEPLPERREKAIGRLIDTASEPEAPQVPIARTDPSGVPLAVDCPSCKKAFAVPKDSDEGNCPHCNVPLAFISEKEFQALQEAEERKKEFQAKMAARRQARKQKELAKEEARKKAEEEKAAQRSNDATVAAEAPAAPTPTKGSRFGFLKRSKKEQSPAPEAPVSSVEVAETSIAPAEPEDSRKNKRQESRPAATVAMEPISIEAPTSIEVQPPIVQDAAPATPPPKKGKSKPAPPPSPPVTSDVDISIQEVSAAPAAAPVEPKKGLFARFRKEKPEATAPASVDVADISFDVAAAPAAEPKARQAKAQTPAPAVVEMGEVSFDAAPAAPEPKARKAKPQAPAPAVVEMGEVSFDSAPSAAPETEISIDMTETPSAPAGKKRRR